MTTFEHLPLGEAQERLADVVDLVQSQHVRVTITKHGRAAAVVMSSEDLESLEETLRILSDPDLRERVRVARLETEGAERMSKEEALAAIRTPE